MTIDRDLNYPLSHAEVADGDAVMDALESFVPETQDRWQLPDDVRVNDTVDLLADDPAHDPERGRRFCVAERAAGGRCSSPPRQDGLLCTAHAGLLDASAGGRALAERRRKARERAEDLDGLRRMGTRAAVAQTLLDEIHLVRQTVRTLLSAAAQGDVQAAKAVIPYMNQALGTPTERLEVTGAPAGADLDNMSTAELEAHLAQLRASRLQAVPAESDAA